MGFRCPNQKRWSIRWFLDYSNQHSHFSLVTPEESELLETLKKDLPELEIHNTNANWQIAKYKEDVLAWRGHPEKSVL